MACYGISDVSGAVVRGLYRGGPAADCGLEPGDVIVSVNGQAVRSEEDCKNFERRLRIGQQVELEVRRADTRTRISITVGEAP